MVPFSLPNPQSFILCFYVRFLCLFFLSWGVSVLIACFLILMKVKHSKQKKAVSVTVKRIFFRVQILVLIKKKQKTLIQQLLSREIKDGMRCKVKADIFKWIWSVCRWMKFSIRINVWQSTNRKKKCDFDLYVCRLLFNSTAFSYDAQ